MDKKTHTGVIGLSYDNRPSNIGVVGIITFWAVAALAVWAVVAAVRFIVG